MKSEYGKLATAATFYGVDPSTVKRWKRDGTINYRQPHGPGGTVRYEMNWRTKNAKKTD